jgi:hypothetical protein
MDRLVDKKSLHGLITATAVAGIVLLSAAHAQDKYPSRPVS